MIKRLLLNIDQRLFGSTVRRWRAERVFEAKRQEAISQTFSFGFDVEYGKSASRLNTLCDQYGSDKGELDSRNNPYPWPSHNYADCYELLFQLRRADVRSVVECGVGTNNPSITSSMGVRGMPGASLRVWRDYFPNAQIVGMDIDQSILFEEERITTYYCDQTCATSIQYFINDADLKERSVDIIIDDGLHVFGAGVSLFESLNRCLTDDGVYVIEDVEADDYLRYLQYFSKSASGFMARFIHLRRPNLAVGNNRMVVITRSNSPSQPVE